MPYLYAQGGNIGDSGGGVVGVSQFTDQGVTYTGNRPCFVWFRGDLYVVGYYTRPVVRHAEDAGRFRLAGIKPPQQELVVVPGDGTSGSDGACLCAITFLHKAGGKVLAESNFGNVVDVGNLAGEGRSWSNIDASSGEQRVTHVRGYVSMAGNTFRAAWEAPYGVTGYEENIRTAQLTYVGPEGWQHGLPPMTRFGHAWAGRMWYANHPQHPYRLWFSMANHPQYVDPADFRDTWDKEPINAIWKGRNELLVLCQRAAYMVRQFGQGASDFILEKLDSDVGCISHFGIQEIHNKVWFPDEDGVWIYDGGFKYLMKEIQPLWEQDWFENKLAFQNGFALHDRINKVYMWVTRRNGRPLFENTGLRPGTVAYCAYYGNFEPSMAGQQQHPDWTLDFKDRFDSCGFYDSNGELIVGSCDGKLRKQDWLDGDDDGDALQKAAIIRRGNDQYFEPGDDVEGGKQLVQFWLYVESEVTAWSINVRGGDEQAWKGALPENDFWFWKADVVASEKTEIRNFKGSRSGVVRKEVTYTPKTVHYFEPEKVTGRGFTFELRAVAPIGLEYRGLGGMWGPGSTQRGVQEYTVYDALAEVTMPDSEFLDLRSDPVVQGLPNWRVRITLSGAMTYPVTVTITGTPVGGQGTPFVETLVISAAGGNPATGATHGSPGNVHDVVVTSLDALGEHSPPVSGRVTLVA